MRRQLAPAIRMLLALTVVCGLVYPLAVTGLVQLGFRDRADGSLVRRGDEVVGSRLLGQAFSAPEWFHPRPSAAGAGASGSLVAETDADGNDLTGPDGRPVLAPAHVSDAANNASGSSNLGPTNPELLAVVDERAAAYRTLNGLADDAEVPVDAVTASGSGVDPHISVANARLQAPRVARERGLAVEAVLELVGRHTEGRALGFLGEPGVNVLELNLAVDAAAR
jgi:K+-transporting ATPase ATPase C chain